MHQKLIPTRLRLRALWSACLALIPIFFGVVVGDVHSLARASLTAPRGVFPRAIAQQTLDGAIVAPMLLLPAGSTFIELHTHIVDITLLDTGNGALRLQTAAQYRLQNPTESSASVSLRLVPADLASDARLPATEISLQVDGQTLLLQPTDSGLTAQVDIPPDSDRTLLLQYVQELGDQPLLALIYPADELSVWGGGPSLRVTLTLPESVASASLLHIQPAGWEYAMSSNIQQPDIQWLYDGLLPSQPFVVEVVPPRYWQEIQNAQSAAASGDLNAALRLGELYTELYTVANGLLANTTLQADATAYGASQQVAQQFYAQAVAAYSTGIESASAADAPESGRLHAGLAGLYRSQILNPDGSINRSYAELLTDEAGIALNVFSAQPDQRQELVQWLHEGLHTMYAAARNSGDWTDALALLGRIETATATYGGGVLSAQEIEDEKRVITMQQALTLLEQGNQSAAMTLAGDALGQVDLQPTADAQSLFSAWQITATIAATEIFIDVLAQPVEAQRDAASAAALTVAQSWQSAGLSAGFADLAPGGFALTLSIPVEGDASITNLSTADFSTAGATAANALPASLEWELLRQLLRQLQPTVTSTPLLFQVQTEIRQTLDLRSAGDQWGAVAASLERQVAQFRSVGDGDAANATIATTEEALQAQLQSISYQNIADVWHTLAQNSWVLVELTTASTASTASSASTTSAAGVGSVIRAGAPVERAWMATVATPPQQLELQARYFSGVRLLLAVIAVVAGLFFLSGLLWWLL